MNTQRRIQFALLGLIAVITGVVLIAYAFKHSAPSSIVSLVLIGLLIDALWSGKINYGLRNAKRSYSRRDQPAAYWAIVILYLGIAFLAMLSLFVTEPEMKTEPNNAIEGMRLLVTDHAFACSAPSNRLPHLER